MKDLNEMTLDELNAEIKREAKLLNQRIDRVRASKRLSEDSKRNALDYLEARATNAAPLGSKGQKQRFSRAKARTVAGARQRLKEMRAAKQSKTRALDLTKSENKRRDSFGKKLFGDDGRALTKKEMNTLGRALNRANQAGMDSSQIISIYKASFDGRRSLFRDGDSLFNFIEKYSEGIPEQQIEALREGLDAGSWIEVTESGEISVYGE